MSGSSTPENFCFVIRPFNFVTTIIHPKSCTENANVYLDCVIVYLCYKFGTNVNIVQHSTKIAVMFLRD